MYLLVKDLHFVSDCYDILYFPYVSIYITDLFYSIYS